MPATGSTAAPWQTGRSSSIPITPAGTGTPLFYNAYRQGDYRGALDIALKVNLPGHWFTHAALAAAYGQLGERDAAAKAAQDAAQARTGFAATVAQGASRSGGSRSSSSA